MLSNPLIGSSIWVLAREMKVEKSLRKERPRTWLRATPASRENSFATFCIRAPHRVVPMKMEMRGAADLTIQNCPDSSVDYAALTRRIKFGRRNRHPWCARAQPEESFACDSEGQIRGHHRGQWFR